MLKVQLVDNVIIQKTDESQLALSRGASMRIALSNMVATLGQWRERAKQRQMLLELDDHMLKDMGINRVDALYEARKPFWKP